MSFTDLTDGEMAYKALWTHQLGQALADNDLLFNDLLTAVTDFANELHFNNNVAIAGEVAAGGSYVDLVKIDASNVVQLGQAGYEVRVPADPTNDLGVCTKQYAEALQMFSTQAEVSVSIAVGGATGLNYTGRGILHMATIIGSGGDPGATTMGISVTIDGVTVYSGTHLSTDGFVHWPAQVGAALAGGAGTDYSDVVDELNWRFNTSCVVAFSNSAGAAKVAKIKYSIIP